MIPSATELQHFAQAQAYVGRPYVAGQYDCAHLAADVQREVFGRSVSLPAVHRQGRLGRAAQIRACRDELAVRIPEPAHGCAVLMRRADLGWHIGTVFMRAGVAWVLHGSSRWGSATLNPAGSLQTRGLAIEGFYAWK